MNPVNNNKSNLAAVSGAFIELLLYIKTRKMKYCIKMIRIKMSGQTKERRCEVTRLSYEQWFNKVFHFKIKLGSKAESRVSSPGLS